MVGSGRIGSTDGGAVAEAERQIRLILNPPTADVGEVYTGKVVNITKFGAFVNILPGRDGLLHISKIGGGKRIDRVEDVLDLGDEIEVRVDDVDPNGKVSLSPGQRRATRPIGRRLRGVVRAAAATAASARGATAPRRASRRRPRVRLVRGRFDSEIRDELGDLGPGRATDAGGGSGGAGGGGGGRGRGRSGRGGGGRRR